MRKWFLLGLSVLLYGAAYVFSSWFFWCAFIFLVPLYYCSLTRPLGFKEGYIYGALQWPAAGWGVLSSLMNMAKGSVVLKFIPTVGVCLYEGIFAGIWFWATQKVITKFSIQSLVGRLAVWVTTTALYFVWIVHFSFCVLNKYEGYFLMHPLLPLAEHTSLLSLMPFMGKEGLSLILFMSSALFTLIFFTESLLKRIGLLLAGMMPWIASVAITPSALPAPAWLEKVVVVPRIFSVGLSLNPLAESVQRYLENAVKSYPKAELIIFPESSFDRINLATAHELGSYWNQESIGQPLNLVIGAFHWDNKRIHNAAYWLYNGKIKAIFEKRHAMPLTETVGPWYDFAFVRAMYHALLPVSASNNPRLPFTMFNKTPLLPYICSELFFNSKPDDTYPGMTIMALCNDTWTVAPYVSRLMLLTARFKAIEWQKDILYASYIHHAYCDKHGGLRPISSV